MNIKLPKLYMIISIALILSGIATMTVGATRVQSDREKHMTSRTENFKNISDLDIHLSQGDLYLQRGTENKITVELVNMPESVALYAQDGKLCIQDDRSINFQFFDISFLNTMESKIKIVLPEQEYQQVMLKINTGDCYISDLQCEEFKLDSDIGNCSVDSIQVKNDCMIDTGTGNTKLQNADTGKTVFSCGIGDCSLENCEMQSLQLETETGGLNLNTVTVQKDCNINSSIGDIMAEKLTCSGSMKIEQGTGECNIQGAEFSGAVDASTDIGDMNFYDIVLHHNLTLNSDTGDIVLDVTGDSDNYAVDCSACIGDVYLNHVKIKQLDLNQNAKYKIIIENDIGDVALNFRE